MAHQLFIQANNSKSARKLNSILKQFEAFKQTLTGFDEEEEANFLKDFLISNKLVEPLNNITPMLWTQSSDLEAMILCNHKATDVYFFICYRLMRLRKASYYKYQVRKNQNPTNIFVWIEDKEKISKRLREKIKPYVLTTPRLLIPELINDFRLKITEHKDLFMSKYSSIKQYDLILSEWIIYLTKIENIYNYFHLSEMMINNNLRFYIHNYGSEELKDNPFEYIQLCIKHFLQFLNENEINTPKELFASNER